MILHYAAQALLLLLATLSIGALALSSSHVHECCSILDSPIALLRCANLSAHAHNEQLLSTTTAEVGFALGIVTFSTQNIWNYSAYSLAVNEAYAEHNGYIMMHLDPSMMPHADSYDSRWNKVKILEDALDPERGWARSLDYVMWVDADLIILGIASLQLQDVIAAHPRAELIVSAEHAGSTTLINSGSILVRNSAWSRRFLNNWWTHADRRSYSDQEQFDLLYNAMKSGRGLQADMQEEFEEHRIAILPPDAINTDPPAMTMQQPHHKVLHLMGEHLPFRRRVFRSAFEQLCAVYYNTSYELPQQLNVTRENLLRWTVEEYSEESGRLQEAYARGVAAGTNALDATTELANSVHHYAHAMSYLGHGGDAEALRQQVYALVRDNIANRREANAECLQRRPAGSPRSPECVFFRADWPEHLKMVAQAGMHLLDVGDMVQRRALALEVQLLLQEMLDICHTEQQGAVRLMIAYMHRKNALYYIEEGRYDDAFELLSTEVRMTRELAARLGQHLLVASLENLANLLSMKKRFREAYELYEECLSLSESHVGSLHHSLAQPTLNYGIALSRGGGSSSASRAMAVAVLRHAGAIMSANDEQFRSSELQRRLQDELLRFEVAGRGEL